MVRGDGEKLGIGTVGADTVEELTDLPLPAPQIRPQHVRLALVVQLLQTDGLSSPADAKCALARCANVQDPPDRRMKWP